MLMREIFDSVPTAEMEQHFLDRTNRHIGLVRKYLDRIVGAFPALAPLRERGLVHDASKFQAPELEPYVWLTWRYRCQDEGAACVLPTGMEQAITAATEHHILTNAHHPESHQGRTANLINPRDRDARPAEMVDATRMSEVDLAEMVADWCAVSEERGNTPQAWADQNVNVRWRFTPAQSQRIAALIRAIW